MAIQYTPTTWINGTTPLNATNLNNMESGIAAASIDDAVIALAESMGWENPESEA